MSPEYPNIAPPEYRTLEKKTVTCPRNIAGISMKQWQRTVPREAALLYVSFIIFKSLVFESSRDILLLFTTQLKCCKDS